MKSTVYVQRAVLIALFTGAVAVQPALAAEDTALRFKNLGMEEGTGSPVAWQKGVQVPGVEQAWDRTVAHGGKASLRLKKTAQRYFPIAQWSQEITVQSTDKARKLRVRCWVKAEKVTKAIVDVTYRAGNAGHVWAAYIGQKQDADPIANHDWKLYEGIVGVPANTSKLGIGLQIYGPGTVWFDDLEVTWVE